MGTIVICSMLRKLREEAGYTQEQVSRLLNIQRQTYCNYENAARTPPLEVITALADLYHVSTDYLIRGINSTLPQSQAHQTQAHQPQVRQAQTHQLQAHQLRTQQMQANQTQVRQTQAQHTQVQTPTHKAQTHQSQIQPAPDTTSDLNPDERTLISIFSTLSQQSQKEIITYAQYKKLFTD